MKTTNRKERYVTRTISSTIVTVECWNRDEKKTESITKTFSGKLDAKSDEMEIFSAFDSLHYRALEITSCKVNEQRYKISEVDFIKYGTPITEKEAEEIEEE